MPCKLLERSLMRELLAEKLDLAVLGGSGRERPANLTGKEVRSRDGGVHWKRAERKVSARAASMVAKESGGHLVTRWTNCHSIWRDFCMAQKAD